jgi:Sec-independent protein translocase protein TatA
MPVDIVIVLVIVLVVVIIWRGPKTIPKLGEALGRGVREARKEASELRSGDDTTDDGTPGGGTPSGG